MTVLVTCPKCRDHLDVPAEFCGRPVKCGTCQNVFTVPDAPNGEPPVARPSRPSPRGRPRDEYDDDRQPRRRSNALVWFVLFGTALVCGGMSVACAGFSVWMYNPTMQVYKSDEGKFQVEFPEAPQPFTQPGEKGAVVKGVESRREAGESRFFVKYYDLTKKQQGQESEKTLEEAVKAEIASLAGGTEVQRQITTHAGHPALDVQLDQGSQFMKRITVLRVILAGNRIYVLGSQGQNQLPQVWYVQRFFISFEPAEKAKPAPPKQPEE